MPQGALSDVKVVDLSQQVAGPYCTKLLADFGAEVIKVEPPEGDPARNMGPFLGDVPDPEKSGTFLHLNTNKKSVTLNLKTETGRKILKELVKGADILVESFAPGLMPELGLSYDELEKINPRLVMASITPFGQTGPYRDYKFNEFTLYAIAGTMHGTGVPDREPQKLGVYVIQMQMGNMAAAATMGAFYGARYKGMGQHVDVAMMEVQAGTMDRGGPNLISAAWCDSPNFVRAYATGFNILPNGAFPCADGYIHCAGGVNPEWWPRFCRVIDRPDMINDPRYAGPNFFNLELREEIEAIFIGWLADKTKVEAMFGGQKEELPITALNSVSDLFTDPQLAQRQYFAEIDHPAAGKLSYPGPQFRMMKTPWRAGPAPLLGEHNEEIYCGRLGYSKEDLVRLRERGVI